MTIPAAAVIDSAFQEQATTAKRPREASDESMDIEENGAVPLAGPSNAPAPVDSDIASKKTRVQDMDIEDGMGRFA